MSSDAVVNPGGIWRAVATGDATALHGSLVPKLTSAPRVFYDMTEKRTLDASERALLEGLVLEVECDPRPGSHRPAVRPVQTMRAARGESGILGDCFSWGDTVQGRSYWERESVKGSTREEVRPLLSRWASEQSQSLRWDGLGAGIMDERVREAFLHGDMNVIVAWMHSVYGEAVAKSYKPRLEKGSLAAITDLMQPLALRKIDSVNLGLDGKGDDKIVALIADGMYSDAHDSWRLRVERMEKPELDQSTHASFAMSMLKKASDPNVQRAIGNHIVQGHTGTWVDYGAKDPDSPHMNYVRMYCREAQKILAAGSLTGFTQNIASAAGYGGRQMPRLTGLNARASGGSAGRASALRRLEHMVA